MPRSLAVTLGGQPVSPPAATPLWSAGHEAGTLAEWAQGGGGGIYPSGTYEHVASADQAHSGFYSMRFRIWTPNTPTSGVRAFRWAETRANREVYCSAWLYWPQAFTLTADPNTGQFLNLFQFKSKNQDGSQDDPVWAFYARPAAGGGHYLRAGWGWGQTILAGPYSDSNVSGKNYEPLVQVAMPIGRWFNLQAFIRQSKDFDGALKLWQDGVLLYDFADIRTAYPNTTYNAWQTDNGWAVNLYSDGMDPDPATLYVDDAAVSLSRIT